MIYWIISIIIIVIVVIKWKTIKMMTAHFRKKIFPGLDERMEEIRNGTLH